MTTIKNINEDEICQDYINSNIGIEALALKNKVGKKKIKEILLKNNITIKKKGGQTKSINYVVDDFRKKKYINNNVYQYIVYDENSDFESTDIYNLGGVLTTYIKEKYQILIPSLYERRMYYMTTGDYWWEQYLKYKKINKLPHKKCPFCKWTTIDIENKSGAFEMHLLKQHNITKQKYIEIKPEESLYFTLINPTENLQMDNDEANYVICKICGKKLRKISNKHLCKHNINKEQYIELYGNDNIMSKNTLKKFQEVANKTNINLSKDRLDKFTSNAEIEIKEFLKEHGVECFKDRKLLKGVELDILIPNKQLAIEYNGNFWHTEIYGKKDRNYHYNKMLLCNKQDISLLQICDDEFIEKKELVLNKISHIIGVSEGEKIYARKCIIKTIYKHESDDFLEKFHIQGKCRGSVYYGCFYNDELIGVMVFKNGNLKNDGWELVRFATDYKYICCGVGGKMFKTFIKEYNPQTVSSFADRRWTTNIYNNLYIKIGFVIDKILKPDYKYYNNKLHNNKRIHKMSLNKNIMIKKFGLDKRLTEWEMARSLGYDRIWDCGLVKYIWTK